MADLMPVIFFGHGNPLNVLWKERLYGRLGCHRQFHSATKLQGTAGLDRSLNPA